MANRITFWGICILLIFIPLPIGLTEKWAIWIFEVVVLVLFALHMCNKHLTDKKIEGNSDDKGVNIPFIMKGLLFIFLVVTVLQMIPLPPTIIKTVSPQTHKIYEGIYTAGLSGLDQVGWKTLSLSPPLTLYKLLQYICFFLLGYLVLKTVKTKKNIEIVALVLIISALFQAVYGFIEYYGGTERIFWYKKELGLGSPSGTFINRNHYAGFLEMIFPISLGYLLMKANFFSAKRGLSLKEKILWFGQEQFQKTMVFAFIPVFIGIGILLSRSRSGVLIFFISVFFMTFLLYLFGRGDKQKDKGKKKHLRIVRIIFVVIVLSAIVIGIRPILERFSEPQYRTEYAQNTLKMIKNYPLFGTGPGTFVHMYLMFDEKLFTVIVEHAHIDYLEIIAESGLIGGGSLILLAYLTLGYIFIKWKNRKDNFAKGIALGCMIGIVSMLIHSFTDFNFQIPANAAYLVVLYALAFCVLGER